MPQPLCAVGMVCRGTGAGPKHKAFDLSPGAQLSGDSHGPLQTVVLLLLGRFKPLIFS